MNFPETNQHRIQIMVYDKLVAEVIGSYEYVNSIWAKWCMACYDKGREAGCAAIYRADIKRAWNIPVGSRFDYETRQVIRENQN